MSQTSDLLKIGEFAKLGDTNLRTLRYYEELALLLPAQRTSGGIRYYRREDLDRLRMIGQLQTLGLTLERIRELMSTRGGTEEREEFLRRVREALLEQDRLLQEKIDALQAQRQVIGQALAKIEDCGVCRHTPVPDNNFCQPCCITGQSLPSALAALF